MNARRVVLFVTVALAVVAITAYGQGGLGEQGESQDSAQRNAGVQRYDSPASGARSPRNANYDIDVRLDHDARTLTGRETIRWRNISAKPTSELQFHLYWNAWRNAESTWLRERKMTRNYTAPRTDG